MTASSVKQALERAGVSSEQIKAVLTDMTTARAAKPTATARAVASDAQVRRARPGVYRVTDARRLYLKKTSADAGSYFLRYRMNGKRPEMGLGSITEISIDAA